LQNDLPPTSVRDLVVHGDDVIVGTHGRSFWILDDIAPLREWARTSARIATARTWLFTPALAYRVRRDTNTDTPLPPDEPLGENPPDGAIFDYALPADTTGRVVLTVSDAKGRIIRSFASDDPAEPIDPGINVPLYWLKPPHNPSAEPGMHRFVWDLKETAPEAFDHDYPIAAIVNDTPRTPEGVLVPPGIYTVRLSVGGAGIARSVHVVMDPRVSTPPSAIAEQYALASQLAAAMNRTYALASAAKTNKNDKLASAYGELNGNLAAMLALVESADEQPTVAMQKTSAVLIAGVSNGARIPIKFRGEDEP
jgi:hypothetical protein